MNGRLIPLAILVMAGIASDSCADPQIPLDEFDKLWDYSKPESTEMRFRALLPVATESGDTSILAQLLTQIARTQGLQGNFNEAHGTLDQVESILSDELKTARVRYLLERGRVYNSSKQPEKARPLFLAAWNLGQEAKEDGFAVDAAHMMGIVEKADSSLVWNRRALALAERSSQPAAGRWLGSLYNNIGWTYHDMGEYETALAMFQKALSWREERGQEPQTRIAKWCVARALRSLGRVEEALAMQRELLSQYEELGETDGYVFEELGECLLSLGKTEEATGYFAEAYRQLSTDRWFADNEADRLKRLRRLGGVTAPVEEER